MREGIRGLLVVPTHRETIGRRARELAVREYTNGVASRYLELLDTGRSREPVRAANGGFVP
jgi:hypothetical protein